MPWKTFALVQKVSGNKQQWENEEQLQFTASESISYAQSRDVQERGVQSRRRGCVVSPLNIYFAHSFLLLRLPPKRYCQRGGSEGGKGGGPRRPLGASQINITVSFYEQQSLLLIAALMASALSRRERENEKERGWGGGTSGRLPQCQLGYWFCFSLRYTSSAWQRCKMPHCLNFL